MRACGIKTLLSDIMSTRWLPYLDKMCLGGRRTKTCVMRSEGLGRAKMWKYKKYITRDHGDCKLLRGSCSARRTGGKDDSATAEGILSSVQVRGKFPHCGRAQSGGPAETLKGFRFIFVSESVRILNSCC
jgi:hypothetical protein